MKSFLTASLLILVVGCASHKGRVSVHPLITPEIPATDSVRYQEAIKPYYAGRYVDGQSTMHEAHTVYRMEQPAHWNLHPGQEETVLVMPHALPNPANAPAPVSDDIVAELNRQKEITRSVTTEATRLTEILRQLSSAVAESKSVAQQNLVLRQQLTETQQRLSVLEKEIHDARSVSTSFEGSSTNHTDELTKPSNP
jgi:hypothetical protein